ncbi:two-component system response regulator [Microbacterium sp. CSI-V]|uniref:response regulator n=1 Tax=unclassified Microbacterium TaxID=2609290 RepID=UPI00097C1CD5|nr:response regulator [Microbacterium sp. CSI-V]MXS74523.1 response regulator [Microbacterium sp. TL13]ONI63118.1 two-component system response regulator [Microbacterium sp. CSI-V]
MIRVLVVDDDALALELHAAYVERLPGFEVVGQAAGARAALTAIADPARPIDLVLLDMTMPDGGGLDVARRVRAMGAGVDIIAVTAVRDAATVRAAVSTGVVQYLIKPFTFAAFRERLEAYRAYAEGLDRAAGEATQSEVDALLGSLRTMAPALPKGLSEETLQAVAERVRTASGAVSSTEVGEREGMSRVTARRYLEHLADVGRVRREPRYGGPGRPEITYAWVRA